MAPWLACRSVVSGMAPWNEALFGDDTKAARYLPPFMLQITPLLRQARAQPGLLSTYSARSCAAFRALVSSSFFFSFPSSSSSPSSDSASAPWEGEPPDVTCPVLRPWPPSVAVRAERLACGVAGAPGSSVRHPFQPLHLGARVVEMDGGSRARARRGHRRRAALVPRLRSAYRVAGDPCLSCCLIVRSCHEAGQAPVPAR